jgi:cardiolipin synthase
MSKNNLNLANLLTALRFILAPLVAYNYSRGYFLSALIFALIALFSDFFDGIVARRFNQVTTLGSFLDPIADKYYELWLVLSFAIAGKLPWYFVGLVWIRNIAQLSSIPVLMWYKKISFKVEPKWYSKWASAIVMVILVLLCLTGFVQLFKYNLSSWLEMYLLNYVLLPVSIIFEIYMLYDYLPRFWQIYHGKHDTFH